MGDSRGIRLSGSLNVDRVVDVEAVDDDVDVEAVDDDDVDDVDKVVEADVDVGCVDDKDVKADVDVGAVDDIDVKADVDIDGFLTRRASISDPFCVKAHSIRFTSNVSTWLSFITKYTQTLGF